MVLGNYYLTLERKGATGEGIVFRDADEAIIAYHNGHVHLHSRVAIQAGSLNNPTFTEEQNSKLLIDDGWENNFQRNFAGIVPIYQRTDRLELTS